MRSGSRCPAFYGEIPPMRWGILDDDGGYFYCITYNTIVGYNSDRLNYKDGVHERYVGVAKIAPYYTGMYTVNSMNGYSIYFSPDIIDFCNQLDSTGLVPLGESYMRDMTRYSVYNSSQLAFLVAHEMGHGYNNDFRDTVNEMA